MSLSINSVFLCGRVGKIWEFKEHGPSKNARISFSVGVDHRRGKQRNTEWHTIVAWGTAAKACKDSLEIGMTVTIEGPIRSQSYRGKRGLTNNIHIEVREIVFMNKALIMAARSLGGPPDEDEFTGDPSDEDDDEAQPL